MAEKAIGGLIIGAIIAIIIGVSLLPVVTDLVNTASVIPTGVEDITLVNATAVALTQDNINTLVLNQTGANLIENTNYTLDPDAGTVTLLTNSLNGTATATISFFEEGTIVSATGRTVASVITVMFAIGLFMIIVGTMNF